MNVLKNRITGRTTDGVDILLKLEPTLRLVDLKGDQNEVFTQQKEKAAAAQVAVVEQVEPQHMFEAPKEAPF